MNKKITLKHLTLTFILIGLIFSLTTYFTKFKKVNNVVTVSNQIRKIAYLTFDDGPSNNTKEILNILDRYKVKATFFVVGPSYKFKNDLLHEININGHTISIHSYEHNYAYIYKSIDNYIDDFEKCRDWIYKYTSTKSKIYRMPGGSSSTIANREDIQKIIYLLNEKGYKHVDWNVDSSDSYSFDYLTLVNNTLNSIKINERNGVYFQNILMHDNSNKVLTVQALPFIIEKLISQGYEFSTLDESLSLVQHVKLD